MSDTTVHAPSLKTPSERDQRIYWEVRGKFRTQRDVAREFDMTQPRVCQIVAKTAEYFARTLPGLDLRLSQAEQMQLVSRECAERRQRLIARAEEEYVKSQQPLVTTISKRMVDEKSWDQRIERGQRGDVRLLKIMQQENDRLAAWAERSHNALKALTSGQGEWPLDDPLSKVPPQHDSVRIDIHSPNTPTTGRRFEGTTRERLLATGKPLSERTRARWEHKIARRRARTLDTSTGCPRAAESAR